MTADSNDFNEITECVKRGERFVLVTHSDPDADGLCSMVALGRALEAGHKDVEMIVGEALHGPLAALNGAEKVATCLENGHHDAVLVLDCSDFFRMSPQLEIAGCSLINIDHHRSNDFFGDLNYVDPDASSTAELVWRLIRALGLPVDKEVAGCLFAGVQSDTGSFIFRNTTSQSLNFAAEMVQLGAIPWESWRLIHASYGVERLHLLRYALETFELHESGKIAMVTVTGEMLEKSGAAQHDCEQIVEFPRNVVGVEIAAMMRQAGSRLFRFSLRSNGEADVAEVAGRFGGGGHKGAAGFEMEGEPEILKHMLIQAAADSLKRNASPVEPQ
ncbi:MAG: DHH family phosphoesterase [Desulfatiglandaceae bacterium]